MEKQYAILCLFAALFIVVIDWGLACWLDWKSIPFPARSGVGCFLAWFLRLSMILAVFLAFLGLRLFSIV